VAVRPGSETSSYFGLSSQTFIAFGSVAERGGGVPDTKAALAFAQNTWILLLGR
jgi:hypothetical protein